MANPEARALVHLFTRPTVPLAEAVARLLRRWMRWWVDRPLGWLPLGGFRTLEWKAPLPRRVEAAMRAGVADGGLGLSQSQVHIVKTCLKSLATSRE